MMIPYADRAMIDVRKLRDYCLSFDHSQGKNKARLFLSALGITAVDADALREELLRAVKSHEARLGKQDEYGQRYTVDFLLEWRGRSAMLRTAWIIERNSEIPRLTTCYPL